MDPLVVRDKWDPSARWVHRVFQGYRDNVANKVLREFRDHPERWGLKGNQDHRVFQDHRANRVLRGSRVGLDVLDSRVSLVPEAKKVIRETRVPEEIWDIPDTQSLVQLVTGG